LVQIFHSQNPMGDFYYLYFLIINFAHFSCLEFHLTQNWEDSAGGHHCWHQFHQKANLDLNSGQPVVNLGRMGIDRREGIGLGEIDLVRKEIDCQC